jgi:hypothetical protein
MADTLVMPVRIPPTLQRIGPNLICEMRDAAEDRVSLFLR